MKLLKLEINSNFYLENYGKPICLVFAYLADSCRIIPTVH